MMRVSMPPSLFERLEMSLEKQCYRDLHPECS
jgi:hypothetical protein